MTINTYRINYCDGINRYDIDRSLDEVKTMADQGMSIPRADICIQDYDGNTLAVRKWHGRVPVSEAQDQSACLDFGYLGHYGPWDDSPETVAECAREDAESIGRIMSNLRAGLHYGEYRADARYPMYWCNLSLSENGQYIHYNHFGSSAIKATPEKLLWLITCIFSMRPAGFEHHFDAYDPEHIETRQSRDTRRAPACQA